MNYFNVALANMVWAGLLLQSRLISVWVILAGLIVEYVLLVCVTDLRRWRAVRADLAMNAASLLIGLFLVPLVTLGWEFFPGQYLYDWLQTGSGGPLGWLVTYCLAVGINALVELAALKIFFRQPFGRRLFGWLCLANAVSVGLALGSLLVFPLRVS